MNFELNEVQRQLQDSLARLLADHGRFDQRRTAAASALGFDERLWQQLSALGVTGLLVPEAQGGFGGRTEDLAVVMQVFGRSLLLAPFLASSVLGTTALRLAADPALQEQLLPALAQGRHRLAWAHDEADAGHARCWLNTRARRDAGGWRLDGNKVLVLAGAAAQQLVVSARVAGATGDPSGRALFLVEAGAPGMTLRPQRLVDDSAAAGLQLCDVPARALGSVDDDSRMAAAIDGCLDISMAAACADMTGAAETAYQLAMVYINTRQQFGRPIGDKQALRHQAAEMLVSLEMCRSMTMAAAVALDQQPGGVDAAEHAADLVRAKLLIGRHARSICHTAIQMHGGIGMTEDCAVGHCLRHVHVMDQLFGDSQAQALRLAAMT